MDLPFSTKDIRAFTRMGPRQMLKQFVNASYSVIGYYMIFKLLSLILNNDYHIAVVISESMSPGFERGDIIWLRKKTHGVGDITVFQLYKNAIPIVHRCIKKIGTRTLTKGDNNLVDDVGLYRPNQYYLAPEDVKSCVVAFVPYFGMMSIWASTIPALKYIMSSIIGLSVLFTRE
ncbi:signal peptidase complex catalytic subunit SEC11 [Vairimorpha necatrix]|uniref:Signal peptidase complex catalytic subunit SEC11 n=1 Tax=Vairimorpha necatrix TaxID=6039 RepID=A0AAX4JD93_9MICR